MNQQQARDGAVHVSDSPVGAGQCENAVRKFSRKDALWLLGAMALALLLRLAGLGHESLWADEYYTLMSSTQPTAGEVLRHVAQADPHPPLYFLFMHGFLKIFGTGDLALRLPSALAGALAPGLMGLLALALFPSRKTVARLAALLLAICPMHFWYSLEARAYANQVTLELAALASAAWGFRANRDQDGDALSYERRWRGAGWLVTSALLAAVALEVHYFSLFVWAALVCLIGWGMFSRRLRFWPAFMTLCLMLIGVARPLAAMLMRLASGEGIGWLQKEHYGPSLFLHVARAQFLGPLWSPLPLWTQLLCGAAGLALVGAGVWSMVGQRRSNPLPLAMIGLGFFFALLTPTCISFVKPIVYYGQRYLIIGVPFTVLALAAGAVDGVNMRGRVRAIGWALLTVLIIGQSIYLGNFYRFRHKHCWDSVGAALVSQARPGDAILVSPESHAGLLGRYLSSGLHATAFNSLGQVREALHGGRVFLVSYGDLRPWLRGGGVTAPTRPSVFQSHCEGQELWLMMLEADQ